MCEFVFDSTICIPTMKLGRLSEICHILHSLTFYILLNIHYILNTLYIYFFTYNLSLHSTYFSIISLYFTLPIYTLHFLHMPHVFYIHPTLYNTFFSFFYLVFAMHTKSFMSFKDLLNFFLTKWISQKWQFRKYKMMMWGP